jgi:thiamine biosynthesis lipoprotein ApbE
MKNSLLKWAILASLLIFIVGCSSGDTSPHENNKSEKTIRTVLKSIFTGPDEEQKKLYKIQATEDPQALYPYLEKKYKSLLEEQYLQKFLKNNQGTTWLQTAFMAGYQLKTAAPIKVQKAKSGGYTFELYVDYSKNGETKSVTIIGDTDTNADGKVTAINIIDDDGLLEKILYPQMQTANEKWGK